MTTTFSQPAGVRLRRDRATTPKDAAVIIQALAEMKEAADTVVFHPAEKEMPK
jgi:hypothetical protein